MGFGSFFTHLVAPAVKLAAPIIRNPIVQLVAPPLALASLATGGGVLGFGAKHSSLSAAQPPAQGNILQPQGQSVYYGAPSYQAPFYSPCNMEEVPRGIIRLDWKLFRHRSIRRYRLILLRRGRLERGRT